jgi:hypothetical protein
MAQPPGTFLLSAASLAQLSNLTRPSAAFINTPRSPAEMAHVRLGEQIAEFEASLSPQEEVGAILIGAPGGLVFHMTRVYHVNMDLLVFEGLNEHGKPLRLVQHVTQLSILLTALPTLDAKPRRIGFDFSKSKDDPATPQPEA